MTQTITIKLTGIAVSAGDIGNDISAFVNLILAPHKGQAIESYEISVGNFEFEPESLEES